MTPPPVTMVVDRRGLAVLHGMLSQVHHPLRAGSQEGDPGRVEEELPGVSGDTVRALARGMSDACSAIEDHLAGDGEQEDLVVGVHAAGLRVRLTASRRAGWAVRLVTTPQVVALWRACADVDRRYWGDRALETVVGCSPQEREAVVDALSGLDPVLQGAYLGSHRPGKQYPPQEQARIFGGLRSWTRSGPTGQPLLRPRASTLHACSVSVHHAHVADRAPTTTGGEQSDEVVLAVGLEGLALLEAGMSCVSGAFARRGVPRARWATREALGVDDDALVALCSVMYETLAQVDAHLACERCAAGAPLSVEVHRSGFALRAAAPRGAPERLSVTTTTRVVALWRAGTDVAEQYWTREHLVTLVGGTAERWDLLVAGIAQLDPVIEHAHLGRHRPGTRYTEREQRRIFGVVLGR